jgi:hypothetical protein
MLNKQLHKELAPYSEALELKELGFNEPCFGWYDSEYQDIINYDHTTNFCGWLEGSHCSAPTFSQAFRWFESKGYRNYVASNHFGGKVNYWFAITPPKELTYSDIKGRNSKEEAELACLRKLIEIVKNKL